MGGCENEGRLHEVKICKKTNNCLPEQANQDREEMKIFLGTAEAVLQLKESVPGLNFLYQPDRIVPSSPRALGTIIQNHRPGSETS